MIQYHPQLSGCPYAASLLAENLSATTQQAPDYRPTGSSGKLGRKIHQWQIQRLKNVQAIIDEYNSQGWNQ